MTVHTLTLGPLATNCYLVVGGDGQGALLVDCAGAPGEIEGAAGSLGLSIELIVITHGHFDHIEALAGLRAAGAPVAVHELDAPMLSDPMLSGAAMFGFPQQASPPDRLLGEGDAVEVPGGGPALTVLHTPGHSPGSICLLGDGALFSGDCLFAGGIGRVDLPGGDERSMMRSLARLAGMETGLAVYPGHGPATTVGREVAGNPWLSDA